MANSGKASKPTGRGNQPYRKVPKTNATRSVIKGSNFPPHNGKPGMGYVPPKGPISSHSDYKPSKGPR